MTQPATVNVAQGVATHRHHEDVGHSAGDTNEPNRLGYFLLRFHLITCQACSTSQRLAQHPVSLTTVTSGLRGGGAMSPATTIPKSWLSRSVMAIRIST